LCDARIPSSKQYTFLNDLLSTAKTDSSYSDDKFQSALLSGKNNLINYGEILVCDKEKLKEKFETKIKPYFDENGQKLITVCIQDVLNEDTLINDTDNIGFESEGYTKQDIVSKQVFSFSELLANVYYYCTTAVLNIPFKTNIVEIKDYANKQKHRTNEVQIETAVSHVQSKVKLTLDPQPFKNVFKEIKDIKLTIPNPNELKIYRLDVASSKIDYKKLQSFIADNIGRYVYSRGMRNRYNLKPDSMELAIKTLKAYNKRVKTVPSTNHFNEIMLYSFLECVLGAPKIFSKMELQDKRGVYNSLSSGIHINTFKRGGIFFNQLVFGATDSIDNLETAIDNALNQVLEIKSVSTDEYEFLENTILNNEFDAETNKVLEGMIFPKKDSGITKPDDAFGLFLGYTVGAAYEPDNALYLTNLEKQMDADISKISAYLEQRINDLGLLNYSFYVYVLPLNNAIFDKTTIMEDALGVDE
jgi:uncharacterized protein (DUF2164 family)